MLAVLIAGVLAPAAYAQTVQTIVINSGIDADPEDGKDDTIRYLAGPHDSGFPNAFTPATFAAAAAEDANLADITTLAWNYCPQGSTGPGARWISTNPTSDYADSALYAVPFTITGAITSVTLDFTYAVDNGLGDPNHQGLFVNGTPINDYGYPRPEEQRYPRTLPTFDITDQVNEGENYLFIYKYDWWAGAALQFTATITITTAPVFYTLSLELKPPTWGDVELDPEPGDPNVPAYEAGTEVTLLAVPVAGKAFKQWEILDPNYPGDPNHATIDANYRTSVFMDTDREIVARFRCGIGVGPMLPVMLGVLGLFVWVRRKA